MRVESFGLAHALVDTRRVYDHLFSIYVPIAVGVFLVIVVDGRHRGGRVPAPTAGTRGAMA